METKCLPFGAESLQAAAALLRAGEVVGMPTETVYGLAADALNEKAVAKIFAAKGRPADNPLIVHIAERGALDELVTAVPPAAERLMDAYWPGPMTLILPKAACIPGIVSAGLDTVGIRMPESEAARALIRAAGRPLAAPSANLSGKPSPTTAQHVLHDMAGRIPLILDAGPCSVGVESSVIDARNEIPIILRPGGITPEMVERVTGAVRVDEHVMKPVLETETVRSPGMKYKHYAPGAEVTIYEGAREHVIAAICVAYDAAAASGMRPAILGFAEHAFGNRATIPLGSEAAPDEAAARLFTALRALDEQGYDRAFCEAVEPTGIGLAVMNRMGRAAAFRIERV